MTLVPGNRLGPYEILAPLGAGGMGEVYRARDSKLGREVAIKVLPEEVAGNPERLARFEREAKLLASLNHPHICTIFEVGTAGAQSYLVLELIAGRPLDSLIPRDGLPVETVLRLGAQIADALAHAHQRGVLHRDLKAANVVVSAEGRAKVLDLGLAAHTRAGMAEDPTLTAAAATAAGAVVGTLHYLSPEALRGEPADARSDLWALGVLLYEMATGERPFAGHTVFEVTSAILRELPAPLPPRVPPGLRTAIQRCLAKEPSLRYQHAGELRAALEATQSAAAAAPASRRPAPPSRAGRRVGRISSVAVLPLDNLSGDPTQDYFADGMTEALIASLAKVASLRVISRTTAMQYKGVRKPLPEIARELRVDAVVEGAVVRSGERVRITAQLIQASTDRHLWAETYERDLSDVLALQGEVTRAIVDEIQVQLTPQEKAGLTTTRRIQPEAYEAYLKGRYAWNRRTHEDLKRAIGHFQRAIDIDPTYALAHAGLADSYNVLGFWGVLPPAECFPAALAAATRAVDLGEPAEAHVSLAYAHLHYRWDFAESARHFAEAIRLSPNYPTAHHWYALHLSSLGRLDEAIAEMRRAEELDPLSLIVRVGTAWVLYFARRYAEARRHAAEVLELNPEFWPAHYVLGMAYGQEGQWAQAVVELERTAALFPDHPNNLATLGYAYAGASREEDARRALAQLMDLAQRRYVRPFDLALIHLGLGEKDRAIEWLEAAYREGGNWMNYLRVEPQFDRLRGDPRFADLLRRIAPRAA